MLKYIFSLAIFTSLLSCNKKNDLNIDTYSGIVLDYSTNLPIANATVYIKRSDGFTTNPNAIYLNPIIDSTVTNSNGIYQLNLSKVPNKILYKESAGKSNYTLVDIICGRGNIIGRQISGDNQVFYDTIYLDKATTVNIIINNIAPSSVTDTLFLSLSHGTICGTFPSGLGFFLTKEKELTGVVSSMNFGDTFSLKAAPIVRLNWSLRNNGIINSGQQTFLPTEFSTNNFNFDY